MKNHFKRIALVSVFAVLGAIPAVAAMQQGTFNVSIKIKGTCGAVVTNTGQADKITAPGPTLSGADINFGEHDAVATSAAIDGSNVGGVSNGIQVTCSKNTPFNIGLTPQNVISSNGAGVMKGVTAANTTDTISYQLYKPTISGSGLSATVGASSSGAVWGDVVGTNTLAFTGKNLSTPISFPVYAQVPANSLDKFVDTYQDQVVVTVSY